MDNICGSAQNHTRPTGGFVPSKLMKDLFPQWFHPHPSVSGSSRTTIGLVGTRTPTTTLEYVCKFISCYTPHTLRGRPWNEMILLPQQLPPFFNVSTVARAPVVSIDGRHLVFSLGQPGTTRWLRVGKKSFGTTSGDSCFLKVYYTNLNKSFQKHINKKHQQTFWSLTQFGAL